VGISILASAIEERKEDELDGRGIGYGSIIPEAVRISEQVHLHAILWGL